jgi:hypothetical protein
MDPQFAEDFAYYADTVFRELGHLVRHWITVRRAGGIRGDGAPALRRPRRLALGARCLLA